MVFTLVFSNEINMTKHIIPVQLMNSTIIYLFYMLKEYGAPAMPTLTVLEP